MLEECLFVRSDKSVLINVTNIDYIKKNRKSELSCGEHGYSFLFVQYDERGL